MQAYLTLTRRELGTFFISWVGYVVIAGTMFLLGMSFVSLLDKLQGTPTPIPVTEIFFNSYYFWLILLFSAPIMTMRLFALEKYSGTFETLMTAPVSDLDVVLAKFSAAMIFYILTWLPLLGCIVTLRYFTRDATFLDPGTLGSSFLGIFLLGTLFMAMGCFASSLTRSQIVAAMIAFAMGLSLFVISFLADQFPVHPGWASETLNYICVTAQMREFARGVVDSRPAVFHLTAAIFFLFLTYRVVESRRWR